MTAKHAIIAASKFNPLNYHEVVRNSFTEVMHRAIPYKYLCAYPAETYIDGFQFDYVFDTREELDAFLVHVPENISKLQCVQLLLEKNRYNDLMQVLDSDQSGVARILFDAAAVLDRDSAMVNQLAAALSFTDADADSFFVEAAKISV